MISNAAQELRSASAVPEAHPGSFSRIEDAIAAIRAGQMVIVADDEDRENEGDLTMAAETITPEAINFMAKYGRGLICLAMTPERLAAMEAAAARDADDSVRLDESVSPVTGRRFTRV